MKSLVYFSPGLVIHYTQEHQPYYERDSDCERENLQDYTKVIQLNIFKRS